MAIELRTKRPDARLKQIVEALKKYGESHPASQISVYRQNSVSVRVRIVSPEFNGVGRAQRDEELWKVLEELPEEVVAEISVLLLLTPREVEKSFANLDFDNPIPSEL